MSLGDEGEGRVQCNLLVSGMDNLVNTRTRLRNAREFGLSILDLRCC